MKKVNLIFLSVVLIVPLLSSAYAENFYDINIPSGSADPTAPFHWQSEKDGDTSGFIEIIVGDAVQWGNADTVPHTITSGTPQDGPDGIFDSGELKPGSGFVQQFKEKGEFPYYCTIHPWRTGLVSVVSGNSFLPRVASDVGDGKTTFNLEYKFNRLLKTSNVDVDSKSITFEFQGRSMSDDNSLTIFLPSALITEIASVSIDGVSTDKFTQEKEDDLTILVIDEIPQFSESLTITGATIIPEFADLAVIVLIISITMIVLLTRKSNLIKNIFELKNFS